MGTEILNCKSDRISFLPQAITNTILTFLPLREAVRTSILSTKWRHVWIKLTKLVFDETLCQVTEGNKPLPSYKLISTINQILLLHSGYIVEFSLSLSNIKSCPEIDHLIVFLSTSSLQTFNLDILRGERYKMPSSFFSFQKLEHMNLSNCIFTLPSAFNGFPRLVSLKFVEVVFSVKEFDIFISSCPKLENLTLIKPPPFHCLAILASRNLKYLHFEGVCKFLSFGYFPLLQSASFHIKGLSTSLEDEDKDNETCRFTQLFCCLPALKKLVAEYDLLQHLTIGGGVPKKLPIALRLEILELSSISLDIQDEVSAIFCLISSSPNIQRIEIEMFGDSDYYPDEYEDEEEVVDFLKSQYCSANANLDNLREVHLTCVHGIEPELEFIKLVLAKSPALETMLIKPQKKGDFSRLRLLETLLRFQRASSMAQIILE